METSKISFLSALLITMNIMIGAGIYISPPDMAVVAGAYSYWGWFAAFLVLLPVVLSFSKLAAYYPGEGGIYNYVKDSLGVFSGFLTAWIYFLGFVGAQCLQTFALRELVGYSMNSQFILDNPWVFNLVFHGSLFLLCWFSMTVIAKWQTLITVLKLSPLFFVVGYLLLNPFKGASSATEMINATASSIPHPETWSEILSLVWKTVPYAIFGYWGFEACSNISHRISGSKKNASRVIVLGFFIVCILYSLFHFEVVRLMGAQGLYEHKVEGFMTYAGWTNASILRVSSIIFMSCLSISYFNAVFSEFLSYSFVIKNLGQEKLFLFPERMRSFNKNAQPTYAIFVNGFLCFLIASLVKDKSSLVAIANIGIIISFAMALLALLKISLREKDYTYVAISLLGFFSCYLITMFSLGILEGDFSKISLLIFLVVIGIGIYFYRMSRLKSEKSN
jgi:APA family basic amino acid/polyamine antiporter